jgi:hypothetical protein
MKRASLLLSICALVVCGVIAVSTTAQAADVNYIKSKLNFFYVADPNAQDTRAQAVDVAKVLANQGTGAFYTDASLEKFRVIVKACCGGNPADVKLTDWLRMILEKTLKITDKPVRIFLINDSGAPITNQDAIDKYGLSLDSGYAWPCALTDPNDRNVTASISFGITWLEDTNQFPDLGAILGMFCHELVHTQDLAASRTHIYGAYGYGFDQTHYTFEAIPDMSSTYSEGIANCASFLYNDVSAQDATDWFTKNLFMVVEKQTPAGLDPNNFIYKQLTTAGVNAITDPNVINYFTQTAGQQFVQNHAFYHIRDLPPHIIRQNEHIIALILYYQATYSSIDHVFEAVKQVNPGVYLVCASAFAQLIEKLGLLSLPEGAAVTFSAADPSAPKDFLLPLALADYFTSFKSTNEAEFKKIFEDMLPDYWITAYWMVRNDVKGTVNLNAPDPKDPERIAMKLGLTCKLPTYYSFP